MMFMLYCTNQAETVLSTVAYSLVPHDYSVMVLAVLKRILQLPLVNL